MLVLSTSDVEWKPPRVHFFNVDSVFGNLKETHSNRARWRVLVNYLLEKNTIFLYYAEV